MKVIRKIKNRSFLAICFEPFYFIVVMFHCQIKAVKLASNGVRLLHSLQLGFCLNKFEVESMAGIKLSFIFTKWISVFPNKFIAVNNLKPPHDPWF